MTLFCLFWFYLVLFSDFFFFIPVLFSGVTQVLLSDFILFVLVLFGFV